MNEFAATPLFEPDPEFASAWFIDDPLAQGALKHASITVLDVLNEASEEAARPHPDLGDIGPLGVFPRSTRPALTPLLVEKVRVAATIVGWKLAQPGPAIPPGCVGEELALELIRQEAVSVLDLVDGPRESVRATKGVYEVCQDDDILDLFEMQEPADAALALTDPINAALGKADMRIEEWFKPFYGGDHGFASHAYYLEKPSTRLVGHEDTRTALTVVGAGPTPDVRATDDESKFRVCIRSWEDSFLERHEMDRLPSTWICYITAATADEARKTALERFPHGATSHTVFDEADDVRLDRADVARISVDVQRRHLPQGFKEGSAFHIVGTLADISPERLPELAGHLDAIFSAAVIAQDAEKTYFGVSVSAESHEEAEADLQDAVELFAHTVGIDEELVNGCTSGHGERDPAALLAEIQNYEPLM